MIQTKHYFRRPVVSIHETKIAPYRCIDVDRPQFNDIILFCQPHSLFDNICDGVYFTIFRSAIKKSLSEKVMTGTFFGDRSNLCSFDGDDVFIMMSDIGSNRYYFAYEPALKYSFEMNLLREMKSCGEILRCEHCDLQQKQLF